MDWPVAQVTIPAAWTPLGAVAALAAVLVAGWISERRHTAKRRVLRRLYQLGERVISERSSAEGLRLLESALPELLGIDDLRVYLADGNTRSLAYVDRAGADLGTPLTLAVEHESFRLNHAELCLRNRSLLAVPDSRRSPLFEGAQAGDTPRSMLFIPMSALDEPLGVFTVGDTRRARAFDEDERAVLQHLANQLAISIRLREQGSLRARTAGSERLEALCQLGSVAAGEVRGTLEALAGPVESARVSLERLQRFTRLHRESESLTDAAAVMRSLVEERAGGGQTRGFQVEYAAGEEPLVVASPGDILRLVFSSLLWHAETRLARGGEGTLTIRTLRLASTAQIDMTWAGVAGETPDADPLDNTESPNVEVASLAVCRALVTVLGGRMRIAACESGARLEIDLPLTQRGLLDAAGAPEAREGAASPLTALIVEPDAAASRPLVAALAEMGHRAIPVATADEAIDLAKRMEFQALFCSVRVPGAAWQDCFQDTRNRVGAFVLLTPGHDPAMEAALAGGEAMVLALPFQRPQLIAVLAAIQARVTAAKR